jgi:hypothetical protein
VLIQWILSHLQAEKECILLKTKWFVLFKGAWLWVPVILFLGCAVNLAQISQPTYQLAEPDTINSKQMADAIKIACVNASWEILEETPGLINAKATAGSLNAEVAISYSANSYKIEHKRSSRGFGYTGELIHRRYNQWVNRLNKHIRKQLQVIRFLS